MNKILLALMVFLVGVSFVSAVNHVECSNGAVNLGENSYSDIVICDDPLDLTCEQDFETLCPQDWHLCSATEYNIGNDHWEGYIPNWLFGEIQCRDYGGAGHYTVWNVGNPFSNDVPNNQYAGSSMPECTSDYGCNEQQYHALCCYGGSNGGSDDGNEEVPEFGLYAGIIAMIGAIAVFVYTRKN